jgi:hypothetical protein
MLPWLGERRQSKAVQALENLPKVMTRAEACAKGRAAVRDFSARFGGERGWKK